MIRQKNQRYVYGRDNVVVTLPIKGDQCDSTSISISMKSPRPPKKSVASKLCISVGVKACSKNLRRAHYWWRASVVKRTSERRNCVLSLIIASFYNSPLWWSVFSLYNFAFCHTCNKQQFSFKRKRKVAKLINLADVIILQILRLTKRYLWVHAVIFDWFST